MLPVFTTMDDVDVWINFLRTKINGSSIKEAESIIGKQYIDGRKLSGIQFWGFITKDGDHISLTPTGWDYSRATAAGKYSIVRDVLAAVTPYKAVLEWAHFQGIEQVTTVDVGSRWLQFNKNEAQTESENTLNNNAVCFFHLAQAGSLGKLLVGRRGQPTRLELDRSALASFVDVQPIADPIAVSTVETEENGHTPKRGYVIDDGLGNETGLPDEPPLSSGGGRLPLAGQENDIPSPGIKRMFVGHGKNHTTVEQLERLLTKFKVPFARAEYEANRARPISQKVAETMKSCNASILVFTADEEFTNQEGNSVWRPSENMVHELRATSVLHGEMVVIFKEEVVDFLSNFSDIGYIAFEKDRLDAKGVDLISELIAFGLLSVTVS